MYIWKKRKLAGSYLPIYYDTDFFPYSWGSLIQVQVFISNGDHILWHRYIPLLMSSDYYK